MARKAVNDAAMAVDLQALAHTDSEAFDASLRKGQAALAVLQPRFQQLTACGESQDTCTKELRGFHRSHL
jgi:hypothetical protein